MRILSRVVVLAVSLVGCEQGSAIDTPEQTRPAPAVVSERVEDLLAPIARFDAWRARYAAEPDLVRRAQLLDEGLKIAVARRTAMEALVRSHPLLALQAAASAEQLAALPEILSSLIERRLDAVGSLGLWGSVGAEGQGGEVHAVAIVGGRVLRATGPGIEGLVRLREGVRLQGVEVGEWVALESGGTGTGSGDVLASTYTEGPKTVLYIRVDFDDLVGEPLTQAAAQATMDSEVAPYYLAQSYARTSITSTTVTPVLRMPQTLAWYKTNGDYQLQTDARAAALAAGFNRANYSFDITAFKRVAEWGYAGKAWVGAPGVWLNGYFTMSVTAHELGHNWGVAHANRWNATGDSIVGAGTHSEYGNQFDVMGGGPSGWAHFNAEFKKRLNWVVPAEVSTVTSSGTYRIFALETSIGSGFHTLSAPRPDGKSYWLEFRTQVPTNATAANGAFVMWNAPTGGRGNEVLDVTPGTSSADSALVLGRTFSDRASGIHFTPIGKGGTSPESLDVVVQLGTFAGNNRPAATLSATATTAAVGGAVTFNASATDADGDALAYGWDFGDGTAETNSAQVTRTFAAARDYRVRVTATDMKGGLSSRSVLVKVGAPTTFRLSGQVLIGGQPLAEARVTDGTRSALTDDDGSFTLVGVPSGSFTLSAIKPGFVTAPGFTNPVAVSANVAALGFTATFAPLRTISGKVLDGTAAVPGVTVTDGTRTSVTDGNGDWSLTNVPDGFFTLSATKAGWAFLPSGFANPVEVLGGALTAVNFASSGVRIYGSVTGASVATTVTDGYRTAQTVLSGTTWSYNLGPMPPGNYTVTATAAGYTVAPGFTNPVAVATSSLFNKNFTAAPSGTTFSVGGTVTAAGVALFGVVVSDGTRTATTDAAGAYLISGVPAGSYTLTPQKTGYTFIPASLAVSVATANVTGQNFTGAAANQAPSLASAALANPNPVTATSAALSVLGADDQGEAALTYTWAATGPAAVTFGANGSNGAKNSTATFARAGSYALTVTVRDAAGLTATGNLAVTVQQTVASIAVSPATASVSVSGTQQFTGSALDQFGQPVSPVLSWTASGGGSISSSGLFTAGASVGGPFTVTASASGKSGTAQVSVTSGAAPTVASAASATPNPVTGTTTALFVLGADDGGEAALTYTWSMLSGPAAVGFSANGTNAAKGSTATFSRAGSYVLQVVLRDVGGLTASSQVTVTAQQTVAAVAVSPASASVKVGTTQQFTASATDQFGQAMGPAPVFTFSVSGGGTLSQSGLFTAGTSAGGPFTVSVTAGGRTGSASVTVTPGTAPTVAAGAAANPNPVMAKTAELSVLGADALGEAALTYTWSMLSGPAAVTFSANGSNAAKSSTATFSRAGSYALQVVIANAGGLTVSSTVTVVVQPTLSRLAVAPASVTVSAGGTATFSAGGFDQFDAPLAATVSWSVSGGGTVSSAGLFTAGVAAGGPFNVTAASGTVFGFAQVSVASGDVTAPAVSVVSPIAGSVLAEMVPMQVNATDAVGVVKVTFLVDGVKKGESTAAPYVYTLDTRAMGNGSHTLQAQALDAAGNLGTSALVSVSVKNRGRKPKIINLADGVALQGTVTVTIGAVDALVNSLAVTVDGQTVVQVDPSRTDLTFDSAVLRNGNAQLAVVAIDAEGDIPSDPVAVVVDNPATGKVPNDGTVLGGCSATGDLSLGALELFALFALATRRRPVRAQR